MSKEKRERRKGALVVVDPIDLAGRWSFVPRESGRVLIYRGRNCCGYSNISEKINAVQQHASSRLELMIGLWCGGQPDSPIIMPRNDGGLIIMPRVNNMTGIAYDLNGSLMGEFEERLINPLGSYTDAWHAVRDLVVPEDRAFTDAIFYRHWSN